jgi:hypothetical protein
MPRPCAVERHAGGYEDSRPPFFETPRVCAVESHAHCYYDKESLEFGSVKLHGTRAVTSQGTGTTASELRRHSPTLCIFQVRTTRARHPSAE